MAQLTIDQAINLLMRYDSEHYTPRHRKAHRMAVDALRAMQKHEGCDWCDPGDEKCGTCNRFFLDFDESCAVDPSTEKCAYYTPIGYCFNCGRRLTPDKTKTSLMGMQTTKEETDYEENC